MDKNDSNMFFYELVAEIIDKYSEEKKILDKFTLEKFFKVNYSR